MSSISATSAVSPTHRRIVWGVRILLALTFSAAGVAKLLGVPQMVQVFDAIGFGEWLRYVTGVVELLGAVLLLVPASGFVGALLLTGTMICAVATHLFLIGGSTAPALVLAMLAGFVAWRLRPESIWPRENV